jgi:hypothetical protein
MPNLQGLYTDQKMWNDQSINDNLYSLGTILQAKENPGISLIIMGYLKRIYYCAILGDPKHKQRAYFERELLVPLPNAVSAFTQVTQRWDGVHRTNAYFRPN